MMRHFFIFSLLCTVILTGCDRNPCTTAQTPKFYPKPIRFSNHRISLTKTYRAQHYGIRTPKITINPQMIVLHWTGSTSLNSAWSTFLPEQLTQPTKLRHASRLNMSVPYLVDRDGTIYQLMPENWMSRHVIGLNHLAIGIENVGGENGKDNLTKAQLQSNVQLVCYLKKKYPKIHYLIGHYEYLRFKNTPLWLEKNPNYYTIKKDPGERFMRAIRKRLSALALESNYQNTHAA